MIAAGCLQRYCTNWRRAAMLVALLAGPSAYGAEPGLAAISPCQGATQWLAAHPAQATEMMALRDTARTLTNTELRENLRMRVALDQRARRTWLASPRDSKRLAEVTRIDANNLTWLRGLVQTPPHADEIGEGGLYDLWLLVQHADRDIALQEIWLTVFQQRLREGEFGANELARLTDRVRKGRGQPQLYGTQFSPEEWLASKFVPPGGRSFPEFDEYRALLGMMPLADYACQMTWERTGSR